MYVCPRPTTRTRTHATYEMSKHSGTNRKESYNLIEAATTKVGQTTTWNENKSSQSSQDERKQKAKTFSVSSLFFFVSLFFQMWWDLVSTCETRVNSKHQHNDQPLSMMKPSMMNYGYLDRCNGSRTPRGGPRNESKNWSIRVLRLMSYIYRMERFFREKCLVFIEEIRVFIGCFPWNPGF